MQFGEAPAEYESCYYLAYDYSGTWLVTVYVTDVSTLTVHLVPGNWNYAAKWLCDSEVDMELVLSGVKIAYNNVQFYIHTVRNSHQFDIYTIRNKRVLCTCTAPWSRWTSITRWSRWSTEWRIASWTRCACCSSRTSVTWSACITRETSWYYTSSCSSDPWRSFWPCIQRQVELAQCKKWRTRCTTFSAMRWLNNLFWVFYRAIRKRCLYYRLVSVRPSVRHVGVLYPDGWMYGQTFLPAQ